MKKILLVVVLLAIVYFIGTIISNAIEDSNQAAQAFPGTNVGGVLITHSSNKVKAEQGKTKVAMATDLKIKAAQKTMVTFLPPKILKDGQPFNVATSALRLDAALMIKRMIWIPGPRFVGPAFEVKKGNNTYRLQWTINKSALPPGSYQFAFGDYMVGQSTTTVSLALIWSKPLLITPPLTTTIDNRDYKLVSYNGNVFTSANTPLIAFRNGRVRIKICNLMEGSYSVNNSTLNISGLVGTEMACSNNYLNQLEQRFGSLVNAGFKMTISGDYLTLTTNRNLHTFVFVKYTPSATTSTTTRVYPCNFVGPLEAGAIRDCGGLTGGVPVVTGVSPTTARIGQQVTITGSNFGISNIVLMDNLSETTYGFLPVATVVAAAGATSLTFTIPNSHSCPQPFAADGLIMQCPNVDITPGSYAIKVRTPGGQSVSSHNITVQAAIPAPTLSSITPTSGRIGTSITVTGSGFAQHSGNGITANAILVDGHNVDTVIGNANTSNTILTFTIPDYIPCNITTGGGTVACTPIYIQPGIHTVAVRNMGVTSNTLNFTVTTQ